MYNSLQYRFIFFFLNQSTVEFSSLIGQNVPIHSLLQQLRP